MSTGAKNMGLYIALYHSGKIKDHIENCNAPYADLFQLEIL